MSGSAILSCVLGSVVLVGGCAVESDEDVSGLGGPLRSRPDEALPAIGIQNGGTLHGAQLDTFPEAGVQSARIGFVLLPGTTADHDGTVLPEHYDWQVEAHARRGIHMLPVVGNGTGIVRRDELDTWQRFASSIAARYGPEGAFWQERPDVPYLPIRAWEIWNEPNLVKFWHDGEAPPRPRHYRRILRRAFVGLRTADPRARVVLGGLAFPGNTDHDDNVPWREFLRKVFDDGGPGRQARNRCLVDAVAIHPYERTVPESMDRIVEVYDFLERRGMTGRDRERRDVQIWITELGWAVPVPGEFPPAGEEPRLAVESEHEQARRVVRVIDEMEDARRRLRLGPLYWYTFEDLPGYHEGNWPDYAGLWTLWPRDADENVTGARGRPREAWLALGHRASAAPPLRLPPVRCSLGDTVERRDRSLRLLAEDDLADAAAEDGAASAGACPEASCMDDAGREICAGDRGLLACPGGTQVCACGADGTFSSCTECVAR